MIKEKQKTDIKNKEKHSDVKNLILFNDDVNTFDFVIETLIEVCGHNSAQAEQCALIAHFKGKCSVKSGDYSELKSLCNKMTQKKLSVEIV